MIRQDFFKRHLLFSLVIILLGCVVASSATLRTRKTAPVIVTLPLQDTIIIIRANTFSLQKDNDSSDLLIVEGNVLAKQGTSIFRADKAIKNNRLNTFEAWGRVHITDADTTHIYADHLKYFGTTQVAHLDCNVKLTDGRVILTTPSLKYDMTTNIGIYNKGGKVVNEKTVITSTEGEYYRDLQDVFFKKNVLVKDPAYEITTDSLQYNTGTRIATFLTQTHIVDSARRTIDTKEGYYNLNTNQAEFRQRPFINDDNKFTLNADVVYLDDNIARAEGNAVAVDSTRGTIIIANLIFQNRLNEAVLATQKPVMIVKQDSDSLYVAADTLFSAKLSDLFEEQVVTPAELPDTDAPTVEKDDSLSVPAITPTVMEQIAAVAPAADSVNMPVINEMDSSIVDDAKANILTQELADSTEKATTLLQADTVIPQRALPAQNVNTPSKDVNKVAVKKDAATISTTFEKPKTTVNDSTDRYFEAFHNVRIYSDSMQAVSDSLFYSFKDSIFRLYKDPVVWGKESQITGDTILLHTKNKKPHWMEAFKNGFIVSYVGSEAYNQVKSSRIDAYFVDGSLDSVRAKGLAESIYYIQDDDSAFSAVNHSTGDIIDSYFNEKQLHKVVFRGNVKGTIYPIQQKKPGEMKLEGFIWKEALRPKTKFELFE
ncbi:OstA-like protein [Niabella digestorum]|uniref:OstA-like protein n=1 Tax=Niabella digestorum TaxID=3117701 RepID=A0ABU7RF42_9BACT